MQVDKMSVWCRDAWEIVFCVSAVLQSSPLTANQQQQKKRAVLPQMDKWLQSDSYLFWTCITMACPTLSGFSSIQLFTVFRAMSAAGSLGKPRKEEKKQCQYQLHPTCRCKRETKTDRRTDRQTDIFTGNRISPKSKESSTSCLSLVDETSCLINCCRRMLPDAQWWENTYRYISRVTMCRY